MLRSHIIMVVSLCLAACAAPKPPPAAPAKKQSPPAGPLAVSAGYMHRCTLARSGEATCEGDDAVDQCRVPDGVKLASVSAGLYHTCGLDRAGAAHCWGSDRGPYKRSVRTLPPPPAGRRFRVVAAGDEMSCGLDLQGKLSCWGVKQWDLPGGSYVHLALGYSHGCVLDAQGRMTCFGGLEHREESYPCQEMEDVPEGTCKPDEKIPRSWTEPDAAARYRMVAAGANHTCAVLSSGAVRCWGADGWGDGNSVWAGQTRVPPGLAPVLAVTAGGGHSCALHRDGQVTCWGDVASPSGKFRAIDSGAMKACGIRRSGEVECW